MRLRGSKTCSVAPVRTASRPPHRLLLAGLICTLCLASSCVERLVIQNIHNLDPDVDSLPDGDGVGNAATGIYEMESQVLRCEGACTYNSGGQSEPGNPTEPDNGGAPMTDSSLCVVGEIYESTLAINQVDGHLYAEVLDAPLVFEGGIDQDGHFDVVGQTTQNDGAILNRTRTAGTLEGDTLEAAAVAHLTGSIGANTIDCTITYDVSGVRGE